MSGAVNQFVAIIRAAGYPLAEPPAPQIVYGQHWLYCPDCAAFSMHRLVSNPGQTPRRYECSFGHEWSVGNGR